MKQIILSFLLVVLLFGGLQARPVDVQMAKSFGIKFMDVNTKNKSATAELVYSAYTDNGLACFYVFAMQPKGFVIVAADDRMKPILGYSTESNFSVPDGENGLQVFFDAYCSDLLQADKEGLRQSPEIMEQWQMLAETGRMSHRSDRSVGPLLTSTWHQTQLYNFHCPEDPNGYGGHVKAGCEATAMAQLMRYWEWPKTGTGSHTYTTTNYGTLSVDFSQADYRYELMPDFLDYTSLEVEIDAVALLTFHAGVSIDMDYAPNASGGPGNPALALQNYFRYSDGITSNNRNEFSDTQWINMLVDEFDNGRPVYYLAVSPTKEVIRGGHGFICDGYDENDFMHFNWGWQGFDNGFYSINAMNLTHHQYNYSHFVYANIRPDEEYYEQPKPVDIIELEATYYGVGMFFATPSETIGGEPLTAIDSVVLLMNGEPIHSFVSLQPNQFVEYMHFYGNNYGEEANRMNYFTLYPVTSNNRGHALTDSVPCWQNDNTFPLTVCLHDTAGDGWLSPALSILDERGIVQYRIGLNEGYNDTVSVDLPVYNDAEWTLYWNYCNEGYEDDDEECAFEVFDCQGNLIYSQTEKPMVGELCRFHVECQSIVAPDYITAEYVYNDDGTYGAQISWALEPNQWFTGFVLLRYSNPNGFEEMEVRTNDFTYFDPVDSGTYYYRVLAEYYTGSSILSQSSFAPNLFNPELDYVMVEVTGVEEFTKSCLAYPNPMNNVLYLAEEAQVEVVDGLGQVAFIGQTAVIDATNWKKGLYLLRLTTADGRRTTQKIIKK